MILRPVNPVSPCGPPTTKRPVGLIRNLVFLSSSFGGKDLLDDFLDDEIFDRLCASTSAACWVEMTTLVMRDGLAVLVLDGDLALRVGTQPFHFAGLADAGQFAAELMRIHDRRGHQLGRFIAGITEHQTLVAGALLRGVLAFGGAGIHALGDVGALGGDGVHDEHACRRGKRHHHARNRFREWRRGRFG